MSIDNQEPVSVYAVIMAMLDQVAGVAWSKLGLQPDPFTGKMDFDLVQAKVAIDVVSDVARHLEATLDEADKRQLQNLLRDLRANYLDKAKQNPS